jgi:hypothetical protein
LSSYLEEEENLTYAVSGSCAEWNVSKRMSVQHFLGQKVVWIEVFGVGKHFWITVDKIWKNWSLCSGGNGVILCNKSRCDNKRNMAPAASTQCHSPRYISLRNPKHLYRTLDNVSRREKLQCTVQYKTTVNTDNKSTN